MKNPSIFTFIIILGLVLGIANLGYSQATKIEAKGTILRIEDKTVTIKSERGKEIILKVENSEGLKVGDRVEVKDGALTATDKAGKIKGTIKLLVEKPT